MEMEKSRDIYNKDIWSHNKGFDSAVFNDFVYQNLISISSNDNRNRHA